MTRAAIERSKKVHAKLNAFVRIDEDSAMQAAERADQERARGRILGVLHGVPMAHKGHVLSHRAGFDLRLSLAQGLASAGDVGCA